MIPQVDGLDASGCVGYPVAHFWSIAALLLRKTQCSFEPRGFSTNRIRWIQLSFVKKSSILSNIGSQKTETVNKGAATGLVHATLQGEVDGNNQIAFICNILQSFDILHHFTLL